MTRTRLVSLCAWALAFALQLAGARAHGLDGPMQIGQLDMAEGRLGARPNQASPSAPVGGRTMIDVPGDRDAILLVPRGGDPREPTPLVVMLHGAGGSARGALDMIDDAAVADGVAVLAVPSSGPTWDVIRGGFGPDVAAIDAALVETFRRVHVDGERIAIAGFSDGASYALSLGLTNGDLFTDVLAFSPGFVAPGRAHGRPHVWITHGTEDRVLAIDRCSRRIVPRLERAGYEVRYHEIEGGGHAMPASIAREALAALAAR